MCACVCVCRFIFLLLKLSVSGSELFLSEQIYSHTCTPTYTHTHMKTHNTNIHKGLNPADGNLMLRSAWSPPLPHSHTFSSSTVKPCPSGQLADTSINTSSARENLTCTFLMFPTQLHFLHKDTEGTVRASALCSATQKLLYTHSIHVCISSQKSYLE